MRTEIREIGPDDALKLLELNTGNRPLSQKVVARYANEMRAGRWRLNGIGISLAGENGATRIVNGQHRLWAVVESGTTQQFLFVWEDDPDVYRTFDVGTNRNLSTFIAMDGTRQSVVVGALSRVVLMYQRFPDRIWDGTLVASTDCFDWYRSQDRVRLSLSVHDFNNMRPKLPAVGTWYAAFSWLIRNESPSGTRFEEFHQPVQFGNDLSTGDPRLALRNYLLGGGTRVQRSDDWRRQASLAVAIRAWNDWLAGTESRHYKFQAGEFRNGKRINSSLPMPTVT